MFDEIAQQRGVEEFAAVITIEAQQGKRQCLLNGLDMIDNTACTFVLGRSALRPAGQNISECQAPDEITGQGVPAVSHGIGFHKTRL